MTCRKSPGGDGAKAAAAQSRRNATPPRITSELTLSERTDVEFSATLEYSIVPSANNRAERVDAEFWALTNRVNEFQTQQVEEYKGRRSTAQLARGFDEMRAIGRPRLELLVSTFGDVVQET